VTGQEIWCYGIGKKTTRVLDLYLLVPVDVRELTTPSEANSTAPGCNA